MTNMQLAGEVASKANAGEASSGPAPAPSGTTPLDELLPSVYAELRHLAARYLRGERVEHTLQPTALVHEAYLRLSGSAGVNWQNPQHFIGFFARLMRQTLTNRAIARRRLKRGGADSMTLTLEFYESRKVDVALIDEALENLGLVDARQAQIVELRFFGGLTIEEIAALLGISEATVKRDWLVAKLWLRRELSAAV